MMITQGTNGVSWGSVNEGVMQGQDILSFVPLHLTARQASAKLEEWIHSWASHKVKFLMPMAGLTSPIICGTQ
eukprot:4880226-Ditylum_brightwellii.AAC.1